MKITAQTQDIPDSNRLPGVRATITRQDDGITVATGTTDVDGYVELTANGAPGNVYIDYLRGTDQFRDDSRSMRPYGAVDPAEFQQTVDDVIGDGVVPYGSQFAITVGAGSVTISTGAAVLNGVHGVWYTDTTVIVSDGARASAIEYSGTGRLRIVDIAAADLTSNHLALYTYTVTGGSITSVTRVATPILQGIVSRYPTLQSVVRAATGDTSNASGEASGNEITLTLESGVTYDIEASASIISRATAGAIAIEIDGNLSSYAANGGDITTTITNSHTRNKTGGSCLIKLYERSDTALAGWVSEYTYGSLGSGTDQFSAPYDIAFSPDGTKCYVCDYTNNRVVYLTYATGVLTWVSTLTITKPLGVCTDASGNVYIVAGSASASSIYRYDSTLTTRAWAVVIPSVSYYGVATDSTYLYYTNPGSGTLVKLQCSNGAAVSSQVGWSTCQGIEYLGGNLYVTISNGKVFRASTSLALTATLIGTVGSAIYGIASDGTDLYISSVDDNVRKINTSGTVLDTFASYGSGSMQLNDPRGVVVDPSGDIWVADTGNNRLQRFDYTTSAFSYDSAVLFARSVPRG